MSRGIKILDDAEWTTYVLAMPLLTDDHRNALAKVIRERMRSDLSLTFAAIAEASGLNDRTIRKLVDGRVDPRSSTMSELERGLRRLGIVPATAIVHQRQGGDK